MSTTSCATLVDAVPFKLKALDMTIRAFFGSSTGLIVCLFLAALGGWLLWSHTGHVLLALPYLLLLACPLMHFMHRGHHNHGNPSSGAAPKPDDPQSR